MSKKKDKDKEKDKDKLAEGTLISHLLELRDRLLSAVVSIILVFIPAVIFRNELFAMVSEPLRAKLPPGSSMVATTITGSFMIPIKLALFFSLFAAMPWVLYQIWSFVAPGLYRHEKRFAVPMLVSSILLFYVGNFFAYKFIFPLAFDFLLNHGPEDVQQLPEISNAVDFVIRLLLAFGVAFEIPVVVVLLTLTGLVPVAKLSSARGYVIIGIFVIAAILTPPDPMSQLLMAIPMWLLYEAGVLAARLLSRKPQADTNEENRSSGA
jgi:sec-independent protein translocase protein TatC